MSREEVRKYYEVRLYSLALVAAVIFLVCVFLFFLFVWRAQYAYAAAVAALAVVAVVGAVRLLQYARVYRHAQAAEPLAESTSVVFSACKGHKYGERKSSVEV